MVLVGAQVRRFKSDAGGDKVLPACASFLDQLREFVSLASPPTNRVKPAAYTDAFRAAFNLFRTDNDTGMFIVWEVTSNPKIFVSLFTTLRVRTVGLARSLSLATLTLVLEYSYPVVG